MNRSINRSVLLLGATALLLVSACAKQESTAPASAPPADQSALPPPADTTATPPPADSGTATPPADSTPPADTSAPPKQ